MKKEIATCDVCGGEQVSPAVGTNFTGAMLAQCDRKIENVDCCDLCFHRIRTKTLKEILREDRSRS